MAATVQIISGHGASSGSFATTETQVDGGTFRFKLADTDSQDVATPIAKPAAGTNYSWRKNLKVKVTVTPAVQISNLRFFSDGVSIATGCNVWAVSAAGYTQATSADASGQLAASSDVTTYTTGSPLTVTAGTVISNPSAGYGSQNCVQLQFSCGTSAVRGVKGPQTFTYRWDEI